MKKLIITFALTFMSSVTATDFLEEFDGKTVSCEIASFSKDPIPSILRSQFRADRIYITFDSQSPMARIGMNVPQEEVLYVIEFKLVDNKLGVFSQFFTMDITKTSFSKEGSKNIMHYEDERKSYRLEFSENLIRDKYKFIKNGDMKFSCRSLFDWY